MLDQSSPLHHPSLQPEGKNTFAFKRLKRALTNCELAPGEAISEGDIAERFGLGRAAVRNALARLEMEGFIFAIPRNGWQVAPITGASIGDVIEARQLVEPQLALGSFSPELLSNLRMISTQLSTLAGRNEVEAIAAARALDRSFLSLLAKRRGEIVSKWMDSALDHSSRLLSYLEGACPAYVAASRNALVDLLEVGDNPGAQALLSREVLQFREYLVDSLLRSSKLSSSVTQGISAGQASALPSLSRKDSRSQAGSLIAEDKDIE